MPDAEDRRPRILVVEDERIVAMDLAMTLDELGYDVVATVATGAAAVEAARTGEPNAILMDIRLAGEMDGIEAAAQIHTDRDVPIIYLTAHADSDTLGRAKQTRPVGYLVKPFRSADLRCAIEIAIHRHEIDAALRQRERALETRMHDLHVDLLDFTGVDDETKEIALANAELEERVVQRTRQLEDAYRELDAFSYSVAHDLRAPLRGIDGFSQALIEDHAANLGPEAHHYLMRIRASTARMGALIEDLLRLSRTAATVLERRPVDVSAMARSLVEAFRAVTGGRRVEMRIEADLSAHGDPALIRILLENLIGNAWKFTAKKAAATIEIGALRQSGETCFFVRDNGAGFAADRARRLFAAFQRFHATTEYEGNGIGLAIVQRIVNRHGGRIWAESQVGQGATFWFVL